MVFFFLPILSLYYIQTEKDSNNKVLLIFEITIKPFFYIVFKLVFAILGFFKLLWY